MGLVVVHVFCLALRVFEAAFVGILSGDETDNDDEESEEEVEADESDAAGNADAVPAVMQRPSARVKEAPAAASGAAEKEKAIEADHSDAAPNAAEKEIEEDHSDAASGAAEKEIEADQSDATSGAAKRKIEADHSYEPGIAEEAHVVMKRPAAAPEDYKVVFCRCAWKPYRVLSADTKKKREWGTIIAPIVTEPDSTLVRATWHDDFTSALDVTKGDYQLESRLAKNKTRKGANILWYGEGKDKEKYSLYVKKDRAPLIILKKGEENNKGQICQLRLNWLEPTIADHEKRVEAGLRIMTKVGEAVCTGDIDLTGVFKKRDELLKQHGLILSTECGAPAAAVAKAVTKKAAAASSAEAVTPPEKAIRGDDLELAKETVAMAASDSAKPAAQKTQLKKAKPVQAKAKPAQPKAEPGQPKKKVQKKNLKVATVDCKAPAEDCSCQGRGTSDSDIEPPAMF